jgi:hypothetical protein
MMTGNSRPGVAGSTERGATLPAIFGLAILAVASLVLGIVLLVPAYHEPPDSLVWRGNTIASLHLSSGPLNALYPWLRDMDRRLVGLGCATLFCQILAQLLFPLVLAPRVGARVRQSSAQGSDGESRAALVRSEVRAVWTPWCLVTVVLLALAAIANLVFIQSGKAPTFAGFSRPIGLSQDLAMALPAILVLPLAGYAIAAVSAAAGVFAGRGMPAVIAALVLVAALDMVVGFAVPDLLMSLDEFVPPPGLARWSTNAVLAGWVVYALANGVMAVLASYLAAPPARTPKAKSAARV